MIHIAVIGAGAAGLKATADLLAAGQRVTLFEATARFGGRARTVTVGDYLFEQGCQWMHSGEINGWAVFAQQQGLETPESPVPTMYAWITGRQDGGTGLADASLLWAFQNIDPVVEAIPEDYGDAAASTGLVLDTPEKRLSAAMSDYGPMEESAELDDYSALDKSRAVGAAGNYLVPTGFGPLLAQYEATFAAGMVARQRLTIRLQTPIIRVDHGDAKVALVAQGNDQYGDFDAVIVTVPTPIVATGRLVFEPELPLAVRQAFQNLPLGSYKKCCFRFTNPVSPAVDLLTRQVYVANAQGEDVWRINFASAGRIVLAYAAGDFARTLDGQQNDTLWPLVRAALQTAGYVVAADPVEVVATNWTNDLYTQGAYSYARPGQASAREVLQEPVGDKVWFAGEATSIPAYGSAHGAYESGRRVAAEILRRLG